MPQLDHVKPALPRLYLLTNDCGTPSRSPTAAWVNPASRRSTRSSAHTCRYSSVQLDFSTASAPCTNVTYAARRGLQRSRRRVTPARTVPVLAFVARLLETEIVDRGGGALVFKSAAGS